MVRLRPSGDYGTPLELPRRLMVGEASRADARRCEVLILGAGAAGMMCAIEAGRRGRQVVLLEQAKKPGRKIRISGGGRCNFTNVNTAPDRFLSENPRFCISALSRYRPEDFIAWVEAAGIAYHEKTLGQLFCDGSAEQIVTLLTEACREVGARLYTEATVTGVESLETGFRVEASTGDWLAERVVVACGGPSIPKMGSSRLGYRIATAFGLELVEPRAALVPFTFGDVLGEAFASLSGLSCPVRVGCRGAAFDEAMLFTHRGLSGPAMLQISSYWQPGDTLEIDLWPAGDLASTLQTERHAQGSRMVEQFLATVLPRRLAQMICVELGLAGRLAELRREEVQSLAQRVHRWRVKPGGTEGMRTAEVTLGGVDTRELSPTSMESKSVPGLYFIGEVVDVTGHLGGYNFQWAWASGYACGQAV